MEWIKNRWVIAAIIIVLIITVITMVILLLCQPRKGTFTNAWYVMRYLMAAGRSIRL